MSVILYSTGCPRCNVLKKKLHEKNIPFEECSNVEKMIDLGIEIVPVLSINDTLLNFSEANTWINSYDEGCDKCKLSLSCQETSSGASKN